MRRSKPALLLVSLLTLGLTPVLAEDGQGPPEATGVQNAIARVEEATQKHIDVLTGLLPQLPEQAQAGIQKAIEAAQKGHDKALAALNATLAHQNGGGQESGATVRASQGSKPSVTGLARARESVASAFEKSVSTLQKVAADAPEAAREHIEAALQNVQQARGVALENLDRLIASERPARPDMSRPERGGRPDRPERPEKPDTPARPERPQVPDRPTPPHG